MGFKARSHSAAIDSPAGRYIADLNDKASVRRALKQLLTDFPHYAATSWQKTQFGSLDSRGEFKEFDLFSERPFFRAAIEHKLIGPVRDYVQAITAHNRKLRDAYCVWNDDENPLGLYAATELATHDAKYIPLYIEFLRTNDMGHEVYHGELISEVVGSWGGTPQGWALIAARLCSICGQHGEDDFMDYVRDLSPREQRTFFVHLLRDAAAASNGRFHVERCLDAMGIQTKAKLIAKAIQKAKTGDAPALDDLRQHEFETAKSNRSRCAGCNKTIDKDEWRFGYKQASNFGSAATSWYHLPCASEKRSVALEFAAASTSKKVPNLKSLAKSAKPTATSVVKGTQVTVFAGKNKGKGGVVFWIGDNQYGPGKRVGVVTADKEKLWCAGNHVRAA